MPDASIVVTMDDKYSDAVKKMSSVTKAFSKDVKQLESVLYALGKNKISLQIDLGKVKSELKAAEKQFEQTQSAADGFNLELIQANYDNIARNLETVTRAVGQTEEAISQAENQAGSGDTQAPNKLIKAAASSGIGQMFKDVMLNAGTAMAGSMLGAEGGTMVSSTLSSAATGAVAGTSILGPGVGTAIGAAVGAALGGLRHGDTGFLERTYCHPQQAQKGQAADTMLTVLRPDGSPIFNLAAACMAKRRGA